MQKLLDNNAMIDLSAVIVTVSDNAPKVMILPDMRLPSGPFSTKHRTLEQGLRGWVLEQSHIDLGYVEQLYTFADKNRRADGKRVVSIGYLALVRGGEKKTSRDDICWSDCYEHLPWEDYRNGPPKRVISVIHKGLAKWRDGAKDSAVRRAREQRISINFPKGARKWNEELVLQRYELLWEAGLIAEAAVNNKSIIPGTAMAMDHRRILATAMARLRAKIKYRPVVFELMPERFTLLQLQNIVEALAGLRVHKQNFRRLVQGQGLVEKTSVRSGATGGRPAKLFAFRREVLRERAVVGTKLPRSS
ncbi:MAG: hypothetical protein PHX43_08175 [Alphaproteobacteria bacterium]|nr:hypothetical protein [Alphaproteobacteria bacterium]